MIRFFEQQKKLPWNNFPLDMMDLVCVCMCYVPLSWLWPCEWLVSTMSCLQRLCSAPGLMLMASFMESAHLISGLPFLLPIFSTISAFYLQWCLRLFALGLALSFWSSRVSIQLYSNTLFQVNRYFFPIDLPHCPAFASIHSNWEYRGLDDLSLGLYWHIFALDLS